MCPNRRINSGNGSGANGFRLQPEELEVGTKLLIFVYLIKSFTHWPKVKQKQPERDHNMYPQAESRERGHQARRKYFELCWRTVHRPTAGYPAHGTA